MLFFGHFIVENDKRPGRLTAADDPAVVYACSRPQE